MSTPVTSFLLNVWLKSVVCKGVVTSLWDDERTRFGNGMGETGS